MWTCCTTHSNIWGSSSRVTETNAGLKSYLWFLYLQSHSFCCFRGNGNFLVVLAQCVRGMCWTRELHGNSHFWNYVVSHSGRKTMAFSCHGDISSSCLINSTSQAHCASRNAVSWFVQKTGINGGEFIFTLLKSLSKIRNLQHIPEWTSA